jgi:hypothetical protein
MKPFEKRTTTISTLLIAATAAGMSIPATARAEPHGYIEQESSLGYFYGTFDQDPNIVLLVGGSAEEFCVDDPDDPFGAEPGVTTERVFVRNDGRVDVKVNDKGQPIYLYESIGEAPDLIVETCEALFDGDPTTTAVEPFASGTAKLKVRVSVITDDLVDVFNSVNGTATGSDGTEYKVRASADLIVENGVPQGDPAEFVSFTLTEIGRG